MKYYYLFLFSLLIILGTCFVLLLHHVERKHQAEKHQTEKHQAEKQYIQPSDK
jgi:hypothetical protein